MGCTKHKTENRYDTNTGINRHKYGHQPARNTNKGTLSVWMKTGLLKLDIDRAEILNFVFVRTMSIEDEENDDGDFVALLLLLLLLLERVQNVICRIQSRRISLAALIRNPIGAKFKASEFFFRTWLRPEMLTGSFRRCLRYFPARSNMRISLNWRGDELRMKSSQSVGSDGLQQRHLLGK